MEDRETKYLAAVFGVVIFVILLIIVLALMNTSTAFNHADYDVPTSITTTTKHELNENDKIRYNANLSEKDFLIAINNVIKGKISYNGVDLLDNDETKFIFIYSFIIPSMLSPFMYIAFGIPFIFLCARNLTFSTAIYIYHTFYNFLNNTMIFKI